MKQDAENARWDIVSREMSNLQPANEFSIRACRERFESLKAGIVGVDRRGDVVTWERGGQ